MNFDNFKKRYYEKLDKAGTPKEARPDSEELAKIYVGLVIFSEYNAEEMQKAQQKAREHLTKTNKIVGVDKKIILPKGGVH